ncbi:preprotein translocase subunit SecE [Ruminococcus flavefaciens]|uniref:preprotein translocase subunit SecE n=1 Tax=Ruminococcus flavefaciens TaxID=1265 RepID=UPI0026ECDF1A|nr:preprotein translocase subunit SecE [Ruminococcus flavefaciens]
MAKNTTLEKKSEKKSEKKEGGKIRKWFKDLKVEFKKVVWPTKKTVINNTSVVLGVIVGSAILVGLIDQGFLGLLRLIYNAG